MKNAGAFSRLRSIRGQGGVSVAPARDWTAQYSVGRLEHPEALRAGQPVAADGVGGIQPSACAGNWATSVVWGRVHKIATGTNLNGYVLNPR